MPTIGAISVKPYQCTRCGREEKHSTNHWGEIYPRCGGCSWKNPLDPAPVWKCLEAVPEGYAKPEPWKKMRLGDVAEVIAI